MVERGSVNSDRILIPGRIGGKRSATPNIDRLCHSFRCQYDSDCNRRSVELHLPDLCSKATDRWNPKRVASGGDSAKSKFPICCGGGLPPH